MNRSPQLARADSIRWASWEVPSVRSTQHQRSSTYNWRRARSASSLGIRASLVACSMATVTATLSSRGPAAEPIITRWNSPICGGAAQSTSEPEKDGRRMHWYWRNCWLTITW